MEEIPYIEVCHISLGLDEFENLCEIVIFLLFAHLVCTLPPNSRSIILGLI